MRRALIEAMLSLLGIPCFGLSSTTSGGKVKIRVAAYNDHSGRMGGVLSEARAHPDYKLTFSEITTRMNGCAR